MQKSPGTNRALQAPARLGACRPTHRTHTTPPHAVCAFTLLPPLQALHHPAPAPHSPHSHSPHPPHSHSQALESLAARAVCAIQIGIRTDDIVNVRTQKLKLPIDIVDDIRSEQIISKGRSTVCKLLGTTENSLNIGGRCLFASCMRNHLYKRDNEWVDDVGSQTRTYS